MSDVVSIAKETFQTAKERHQEIKESLDWFYFINTAKKADIILDGTSKWILTGNSFVSSITPGMADFSNIIDNGYTIYYDADNPTNVYLNGETITLQDGGILTPIKK